MSRTTWPLAAMMIGLPLWWVLGLASVAPVLLALPMAAQLLRNRPIHVPAGFGWWALFLIWVVLGVAVLWIDAPGAVPGGGSSRLLVFAFRLSWYVACTIALLWVTNLDRSKVTDRSVHMLMASLFVVATAGGLLGTLAPELEFRSALEWVLPGAIRSNSFVHTTIHPEAADVQSILGAPGARPKAPFAYTTTWGSCMALSLVFLCAAALTKRRWLLRAAAVAIVGCALIPIGLSLNRGLWAALAAVLVGGLVLLGVRRGPGHLAAGVAVVALASAVLWASPLGDLVERRAENPHSNNRRGMLLSETVASVTEGSPLVGFGSTRDVQGGFASIAGGATPNCPACDPPPLGTQGQLWLILFSQGWLGLAFFLLFVALALARSVRCRTTNEAICTFVAGIFLLQLPIYDTLGLPLMVVMVAIGLVARERIPLERQRTLGAVGREVRRGAPAIAILTATGAAVGGAAIVGSADPAYAGRVSVAITPAPVYLDTGEPTAEQALRRPARDMTLDTEVALLLSERAVSGVSRRVDVESNRLRPMVAVTAVTNSHVLELSAVAASPAAAERVVAAFATSYLEERRRYLDNRRDHLLQRLSDELSSLNRRDLGAGPARRELVGAVIRLESSRQDIGFIVRRTPAVVVSPPMALGGATGAGLGMLVALAAITLSPTGTGLPRRRDRGAPR